MQGQGLSQQWQVLLVSLAPFSFPAWDPWLSKLYPLSPTLAFPFIPLTFIKFLL